MSRRWRHVNIADRGIWTAKKRYILNVWDSEGVRYAEPKMKICGMRPLDHPHQHSSETNFSAYDIIIAQDNDVLIDYIDKVKEYEERRVCQYCFPRGVNGLKNTNSTSIQRVHLFMSEALLYNHHVSRNKLTQIPLIQEGEKITTSRPPTPSRKT